MSVAAYSGPAGDFPSHSVFDGAVNRGEAARVVVTDDDGEHFGWQFTEEAAAHYHATGPDRVLIAGCKVLSTARQQASDALTAAEAQRQSKITQARNRIRTQVARVKAVTPQSALSDQDKWLRDLTLILAQEE